MPRTFDPATTALLRDTKEIRIRTSQKSPGVVIWIVTVDGSAFVRSVQGPAGKWFRAASRRGQATLEIGDNQFPVQAIPVADETTIAAVSQAFLQKYAASPYAPSIVRPETLPTTLRLDPL